MGLKWPDFLYVSRDSLNMPFPGRALGGAQIGLFGTPFWRAFWGLNHIESRLGAQCTLAIWALQKGPK